MIACRLVHSYQRLLGDYSHDTKKLRTTTLRKDGYVQISTSSFRLLWHRRHYAIPQQWCRYIPYARRHIPEYEVFITSAMIISNLTQLFQSSISNLWWFVHECLGKVYLVFAQETFKNWRWWRGGGHRRLRFLQEHYKQGRRLRVANGATAPGPALEGAPRFRPMSLSSYILR